MMDLDLSKKEWVAFKIGDLFKTGKGTYLKKSMSIPGSNPHITASAINNGVSSFIGNKTLFPKNFITIEKVRLTSFYQPSPFFCSHDVSCITHDKLNKYNGLFISSMINRQGDKYSYGRQAQLNVVKRETVFLPVDLEGEPDWECMEAYGRRIINEKINRYNIYSKNILKKYKSIPLPELNEIKWGEFFLKEIFKEIQRGKRLTKSNQLAGDKPYISSTGYNNGIDNFIGNSEKVRLFSNCLTLANSGSVGATFFHPYEFVASDHVTHLKGNFTKHTYLFLSSVLNRLSSKYNFNREINDKRIMREKIMLPILDSGQPDYEYMEQYMINKEIESRKKYKPNTKA
ncbi:restriction endonuclease subunit S [Pseudoalteromonas atlantica]|uniref:restriction endonuclease subunit S n=1 Tax=Pseudoalteromonas atlantica TaxID=288 RepID=UPI003A9811FA